ncbi:hypothetical protein LPJ57_000810 [Coemansia sp. RSA 486]|nr:hypothetical protein LPJ57_000810 [Coemansia sp. RSA 486]KAJ2235910.1 hypothetical protein IWW45_002221 [Coemansia sp. RSA 485]
MDYTEVSRALLNAVSRILRPRHLCAGAVAYIAWRAIHARFISPLRRIPGPFIARISPLPSLVLGLTRCTNDDMVSDCEKYGSIYVMEPKKVAICHPEDCRLILSSYSYSKDALYSNVDFMEPNIFLTRDAELNKKRRRQVGPALSMHGLLNMEPTILQAGVQQLMHKWDRDIEKEGGKTRVCYFLDLTLMSFDIIATIGFGKEHRSLTTGDKTIAHWVEKTFALMIVQMVLPLVKHRPFRYLTDIFLRKHVDEFFAFGHRAIRERKQMLSKGLAAKPTDILQSFIDAEDPESRIKMTSSQVITETIMMLLSGADTSSTALSWTLHLLMLYPEHYKTLVSQIRGAFASKDQLITYNMAKQKAPYLEACILESLRLCPVSTNLPRIIPKGGVNIRGHHIPEGFRVAVSTAAANKNPETWTNPHLYDPTRFINNEANRKNLMTLSAGVRICPGRHLVMVEMMTTLANLLNRYDFELPADALYTPHNLDSNGIPEIMPRTNLVAMIPKHPARDCNVVISARK